MGASLRLRDDAFAAYERVFCLPWTACDVILPRQISQYLGLSASRYGMRASTVHDATWPRQCGEIRLDQPTSMTAGGNPSMQRRSHTVPTRRRCLLQRPYASASLMSLPPKQRSAKRHARCRAARGDCANCSGDKTARAADCAVLKIVPSAGKSADHRPR